MRIKLTISYRGTDYSGWQRQKNSVSVQQTLEEALLALTGRETKTVASGRTDEGVHALGQVVHFDTDSAIPAGKFAAALNSLLPKTIRVLSSKRVEDNFSARYDVKKKTYLYKLYVGECENPTKIGLETFIKGDLDDKKMAEAAKALIGEHDFTSFRASGSSVLTSTRVIYDAKIERKGNEIEFYVTGSGFLYNMVRIIVGTLVDVGSGKKQPEDMGKIIDKKDRRAAGKTLSPNGLYLYSVEY